MAKERDKNLARRLEELLEPIVRSEGLILVELQYRSEGGGQVLRLFVDRQDVSQGSVSLEECSLISRQAGDLLDVEDVIPQKYRLEVSSPGLTRKLKSNREYELFAGRTAKLAVKGQDNKVKTIRGILRGLQGEDALLETEGKISAFPLAQIVKANLDI